VILPLLLIPGLFIAFYSLKGGTGVKKVPVAGYIMGFNTELPGALFNKKEAGMTKLDFYKKSDEDSVKRRRSLQLDPYRGGVPIASSTKANDLSGHFTPGNPILSAGSLPVENPKADELLKRLEQLRQSIRKPAPYPGSVTASSLRDRELPVSRPPEAPNIVGMPNIARLEQMLREGQQIHGRPADTVATDTRVEADPRLESLNKMLDKVIRIQQARSAGLWEAGETAGVAGDVPASRDATVDTDTGSTGVAHHAEAPPAVPSSSTIPAVVEGEQALVSGATMALRLTEEVTVNGIRIPPNQLVYGQVSINKDRMLIIINSIRHDRSIYTTALQAYDMDGLPGIHIPDMLSRDVARQSADQGISALNLATFSPSIGAQAANAGIQATKSLFARKIRLVRVSVPGGYQVLLRNIKGSGLSVVSDAPDLSGMSSLHDDPRRTPSVRIDDSVKTTVNETFTPFLHRSVSEGNVRLVLQGIYLRDGLLWFSFLLKNQSPIGYSPEYMRCYIRERKKVKRMAVQEIPLRPLVERLPRVVAGGSEQLIDLGFRPFTLSKDKKLALQVAEQDGGRELNLSIPSKILLKAK
jgi:hypothetical protein